MLAGVVMVVILLIAAAVKFGPDWVSDADQATTTPASAATATTYDDATTTPTPESTTTTAEPTAGPAGLVAIEQPGDRAEEVAAMFETYFGGINADDPAQALSVVKPSKKLDPSRPEDVAGFGDAIATTHDEDIRLGTVSDNGSTVSADLSFRSRQDPGYGPKGTPDQTCTAWTMHYTLADGSAGLLIQSVDAKHRSC